MARGVWLNNGTLMETAPGAVPWDARDASPSWDAYLHSHCWLDDFAALRGEIPWCPGARWTHEWIAEFGQGRGPGWTLDLTAQRQIRWLCHQGHLLSQASDREAARFARALTRQGRFLAWAWKWSPTGVPRLEVLAALILSRIEAPDRARVRYLKTAFGRAAETIIGEEARMLGRNPSQLLRLVDILSAMQQSLEGLGYTLDERHASALAHFGPQLAALSAGEGRLARFHGAPAGRAGDAGRVLARLAPNTPLPDYALGYGTLRCAASRLVMDVAPGPRFASALATEFTVSGQPLVVNSGSGVGFGEVAQAMAQTTRAHSTISLFQGSHELNPAATPSGFEGMEMRDETAARWLIGRSGAWRHSHGVAYRRRIRLSNDGLSLQGEELLQPETDADCNRLAAHLRSAGAEPHFDLRFIIHPDVKVLHAARPEEVRLRLPSGRLWRLRCRDSRLRTESALFYDRARLHRRATKTIVASGRFLEYLGRITWSLESVDPS